MYIQVSVCSSQQRMRPHPRHRPLARERAPVFLDGLHAAQNRDYCHGIKTRHDLLPSRTGEGKRHQQPEANDDFEKSQVGRTASHALLFTPDSGASCPCSSCAATAERSRHNHARDRLAGNGTSVHPALEKEDQFFRSKQLRLPPTIPSTIQRVEPPRIILKRA